MLTTEQFFRTSVTSCIKKVPVRIRKDASDKSGSFQLTAVRDVKTTLVSIAEVTCWWRDIAFLMESEGTIFTIMDNGKPVAQLSRVEDASYEVRYLLSTRPKYFCQLY